MDINVNQENENRIKSAMLVFALEKSLGELVKNTSINPLISESGPLKKVEARSSVTRSNTIKERIVDAVSASFLEEIMNLAIEVTKDTSNHDDVKRLSELSLQLELLAIRNAISHPNRHFPECYWYRAAALASDPTIDRLNLSDVRLALQAAEKGKITSPPEDWMAQSISFVPNNLPREFQHELTGLLGRQNEARELEGFMKLGKFKLLSIVAPGGTGKTALILDVLRRCSMDSRSHQWCKGIIFVSLKQTSLTADGIEEHAASKTLIEIMEDICSAVEVLFPELKIDSFTEAVSSLDNVPIILCVDNLETLLRDQPKAFDEFYSQIPSSWTVIVTSRVTVDGAKTIPLSPLPFESSMGLTFKYFSAIGNERIEKEIVEQICRCSKNNPLAIRLTVDRYSKGFPLVEATTSVQSDIVAFSYRNLIETLSDSANKILECLFVCGRLGRSEIDDYLKIGPDAAAQAIKDLVSTSLIIRSDSSDEEMVELSQSVRDLLRENPRDSKLRDSVRRQINERTHSIRQHQFIQRNRQLSKFSENYIDENIPAALNAQIVKSIRLLKDDNVTHGQYVKMVNELDRFRSSYGRLPIFSTTIARLYEAIGDYIAAEQELQRLATEESLLPRLLLSEMLLKQHRSKEAFELFLKLKEDGWTLVEKSDEFTAYRIWNGLLRAVCEDNRFSQHQELAKQASGSRDIVLLGCFSSALGLIREASNIHQTEQDKAVKTLLSASKKLAKNPGNENRKLVSLWSSSSRYLIREIYHLFRNGLREEIHSEFCECLIQIEPHLHEAFDDRNGYNEKIEKVTTFRSFCHPNNPFLKNEWSEFCGEEERYNELEQAGYSIVQIVKIPDSEDVPKFVFAETREGRPVFVPRSCCVDFDWILWAKLRHGSKIAYKWLEEPSDPSKYPIAQEVMFI